MLIIILTIILSMHPASTPTFLSFLIRCTPLIYDPCAIVNSIAANFGWSYTDTNSHVSLTAYKYLMLAITEMLDYVSGYWTVIKTKAIFLRIKFLKLTKMSESSKIGMTLKVFSCTVYCTYHISSNEITIHMHNSSF